MCLANDNYINGTDKTYKKWSVDANCNLRVEVLLKAESIFAVLLVSHYSLYGSLLECLCGSYLCYCHYLMPHCPLGVLSTRVYIYMPMWPEYKERGLKWGHIKIKQHLRGLGTDGNSLHYGSSIMNSKMTVQKLRKFQKWGPWWVLRLWYWVINLRAWKSNLCGSNETTSLPCSEKRHAPIYSKSMYFIN